MHQSFIAASLREAFMPRSKYLLHSFALLGCWRCSQGSCAVENLFNQQRFMIFPARASQGPLWDHRCPKRCLKRTQSHPKTPKDPLKRPQEHAQTAPTGPVSIPEAPSGPQFRCSLTCVADLNYMLQAPRAPQEWRQKRQKPQKHPGASKHFHKCPTKL